MAILTLSGQETFVLQAKLEDNVETTIAYLKEQVQIVKDGYDRSKHPAMIAVRPMTLDEARTLNYSHIEFIGLGNDLRRAKVNGKCRTWKRDATRIELPIKYGMYEYTMFEHRADGRIGNSAAMAVVRV
jgi:hypothetical protein